LQPAQATALDGPLAALGDRFGSKLKGSPLANVFRFASDSGMASYLYGFTP
jgi:hypothetical protein